MTQIFHKYQATGNDFILYDNRQDTFPKKDTKMIARLCHRRFGIGADGLILLEADNSTDFRMVYFNSDGKEGSMCGNGGRCVVAFARKLGVVGDTCEFVAVDGVHKAYVEQGGVVLGMADVTEVHSKPKYLWLDTGSPHHVQVWEDWEGLNVKKEGERLRYGLYGQRGSNINFVKLLGDATFEVRTYERGVEDETYSCGTGVTATSLAMHYLGHLDTTRARIITKGGDLEVTFNPTPDGYSNIKLKGPAEWVFSGRMP